MSETEAVLTRIEDHVMIITINRPEARNAINLAVHMGIGEALETAEADSEIRAVILIGAGDLAFCAGADLKAVARGESISPETAREASWGFAGYVRHHISKPTIAAVNGFALGGGTELTLAGELAVAAESATFGLPEVKRGILAAAGGAFRLPKQLPKKIAMELILTGEPLSARRALELGLVNEIVPAGETLNAAKRLAARISVNAPLSVQASKRLACGIAGGNVAEEAANWVQNDVEARLVMASDDAKEGPRAFAQKREPQWKAC